MESASTQDKVNAAIEAVDNALPTLLTSPSAEFQVEFGVDSNGRDAVFITVILDDDPSGNLYDWPRLSPIHDLVWKEFIDRGLNQLPHIEFRLKSESGSDSDTADVTVG